MENISEQFIADTLDREHRRLIASVLNDLEMMMGKDEKRSTLVKNIANQAKRIMFTALTKTTVEPKEYPK